MPTAAFKDRSCTQVVGDNVEASDAVKDILSAVNARAIQAKATRVNIESPSLTSMQMTPICISCSPSPLLVPCSLRESFLFPYENSIRRLTKIPCLATAMSRVTAETYHSIMQENVLEESASARNIPVHNRDAMTAAQAYRQATSSYTFSFPHVGSLPSDP